jgi:prevent-host-death family protein
MRKLPPTVGVRELRAHLSTYLRAVAAGKSVTIGDRRRRPIARLVPIEHDATEDHLNQLAARGLLRRAKGGKPGPFRPVKLRGNGPSLSEIVIQGRR